MEFVHQIHDDIVEAEFADLHRLQHDYVFRSVICVYCLWVGYGWVWYATGGAVCCLGPPHLVLRLVRVSWGVGVGFHGEV